MTDITTWYNDTFYPFQDTILQRIDRLQTGLYLTGGTAASRAYLNHRYSDDLDFFAQDAAEFEIWFSRCLEAVKQEVENVQVLTREARFCRCVLSKGEVQMKLEFVNDVPSRIGSVHDHPVLGKIDSPENILANKITAAIDRREPKDIADIWGFCVKLNLSVRDAITGAQGKAAGVFPPDLARVLLTTTEDDWLAIRWSEAPSLSDFLKQIHYIGESLLLQP